MTPATMEALSPSSGDKGTPVTTAESSFNSSSTLLDFLPNSSRRTTGDRSFRRFSSFSSASSTTTATTSPPLAYHTYTPTSPATTTKDTTKHPQTPRAADNGVIPPPFSPVTSTVASSFASSSFSTSQSLCQRRRSSNSCTKGINLVGLSASWEMLLNARDATSKEDEEEEIQFEYHPSALLEPSEELVVVEKHGETTPHKEDSNPQNEPLHTEDDSEYLSDDDEYEEITVGTAEYMEWLEQHPPQPHIEISFDQRETTVDDDSTVGFELPFEISSISTSHGEWLQEEEIEISFEEEEGEGGGGCSNPGSPLFRVSPFAENELEHGSNSNSVPRDLFLPILRKKLFSGAGQEDVCSDTMSTTHASVGEEELEQIIKPERGDTVSVTSHVSDPPLTPLSVSVKTVEPKQQGDYTTFRPGLSPKKTVHTTERSTVASPAREGRTEKSKNLPVAEVVKNDLPASEQKFPVVSLSFLANPLTPETIHRMLAQSWSILEPGGTMYVCHVIQRRLDMPDFPGDCDSSDSSPKVKLSPSNFTFDDIVPNKDTVACLGPHIPNNMKEHIHLVDGPGGVKSRTLEIETLQILQNQPHKRGITSFNPQHDLIQRWKGVKPSA